MVEFIYKYDGKTDVSVQATPYARIFNGETLKPIPDSEVTSETEEASETKKASETKEASGDEVNLDGHATALASGMAMLVTIALFVQ